MPGNKQAVDLFNACSSSIKYTSTMDGVYAMGFDWTEIKMLAGVLGVKFTPGIYGKLKALETAFLKHFNNKKKTTPATKGGNA